MTHSEIEEKVKTFMIDDMEIDSLDCVDIVVIVDKIFSFKIKSE